MKHLTNLFETIIIVLLAPVILLPEMAYFIGDRAINKIKNVMGEL